ncbi:hypothetical protein [Pseudomonas faucium]|uniref:hypothetical protein n=1 Tax=Pseudomonas faucium TaxID=2740518 RepID=UPI001596EE25|nr:hypothetical protein [Pseudomonas faucium]
MTSSLAGGSLLLCFSLAGCAIDKSLSPAMDGEQITVTLKVPEELVAREMQVIYRSKLCTFTDHSASGVPYQRDGYQRTDIQPVRQGQSDLYEAKLAVDGGGSCQWRLSNVTFGVRYKTPTLFGDGAVHGAGGGVVVIFDNNNSGRGGADREVEGDLILKQDFYPWVHERYIGGYRKSVSLKGEGSIYIKYKAARARYVYYEPVVHSEFVARSVGLKKQRIGARIIFHYPDGSSSPEIQTEPSYRKLQAIRLAAEGKK